MTDESILIAMRQQLDCYQRLAKLAQVQHDHVRDSRTEDLLLVLTQRQHLLDQIAELESVIGGARKRWSDYLDELPEASRGEAELLMATTRRLLEEITTSDRNDALVLQQRKINLGRQINQASAAGQFNRAYAKAAYGKRAASLDVQR